MVYDFFYLHTSGVGKRPVLKELALFVELPKPIAEEELEGDIDPDPPREVEKGSKDKKQEPKPAVVKHRKQDKIFRQSRMGILENIVVQKEVQQNDNPPYPHKLYLRSIKLQSKQGNEVCRDKKRKKSPDKYHHEKFEVHDPFERQ